MQKNGKTKRKEQEEEETRESLCLSLSCKPDVGEECSALRYVHFLSVAVQSYAKANALSLSNHG